jgi:iron complex transport system ATP-binding protein
MTANPSAIEHAVLRCDGLTVRAGDRLLVDRLDLEISAGDRLAILGQNGSGKTLTLRTLAGLRRPGSGRVWLHGARLDDMPRRDVARRLSLLPQQQEDVFPATVLDTVLAGRHPHIGRWRWETSEDVRIAADALQRVGIEHLGGRDTGTLSGGERQRTAIAQLIAQDTPIALLDEPTSQLDPAHAMQVLALMGAMADSGKAVVAALHDMNLAARFATHALLLFGDGRWRCGESAAVLRADTLSALYGADVRQTRLDGLPVFVTVGVTGGAPGRAAAG